MIAIIRRGLRCHARNTAITVAAVAMMIFARSGRAQATSVTVVEVPSPQSFTAELKQRGASVTDELLNSVRPGTRTFVVIATRDAAWIAELHADATAAERQRLVEAAAGVLDAAASGPSVSGASRQMLAGLQRRLREESGGLVTFDHKTLGAHDLVMPLPLALSEPATVTAVPQNTVVARPPPAMVRSTFVRNIAFALAFLTIGFITISWLRAKQRADIALLQKFTSSVPSLVQIGSRRTPTNRQPRFGAVGNSASTGAFSRRPVSNRARGLAVVALLVAAAGTLAAQQRDSLPSAKQVGVVTPTPRKTVTLRARDQSRTASSVDRMAVDVSGSIRDRAIATARQIAGVLMANGQAVDLSVFGDSLVHLGEVTSPAKSDSLLAAQPRHRRTHLGEAIVAMLDTNPIPHRTRLTVLISDLQPDDAGDESLRYLPSGHVAPRDTLRVDSQPPAFGRADALGLGIATSAAALLLGLALGRREERRRGPEWIGRNVRVAFRGRAGRTLREVSLRELIDPFPLFADDVGTRHRPFAVTDAADLELSTTFATAGATILVAPHAIGRHPHAARGSDA